MILTFFQKSIWLAYFHGLFAKTLKYNYKSFLGPGDAFLIPHEHPLRGELLLLIILINDHFQKVSAPGCYIFDTHRLDITFGQS